MILRLVLQEAWSSQLVVVSHVEFIISLLFVLIIKPLMWHVSVNQTCVCLCNDQTSLSLSHLSSVYLDDSQPWVTFYSPLAGNSPALLCHSCFSSQAKNSERSFVCCYVKTILSVASLTAIAVYTAQGQQRGAPVKMFLRWSHSCGV